MVNNIDNIDKNSKNEKLLRVSEVAKILNIHPSTIRLWIRSGRLNAVKTKGGHYRIPETEVIRMLKRVRSKETRAAIYVRKRFTELRDELNREASILKRYCKKKGYRIVKVFSEISPLDYSVEVGKLLSLAVNREIDVIVVSNIDEIFPLCYKYIEILLEGYNVRIEIPSISKLSKKRLELLEDLIHILKIYSKKICPKCKGLSSLEKEIRDYFLNARGYE